MNERKELLKLEEKGVFTYTRRTGLFALPPGKLLSVTVSTFEFFVETRISCALSNF